MALVCKRHHGCVDYLERFRCLQEWKAVLAEHKPDIVLHGHSHKYSVVESGDICYCNPGSAGPARFQLPRTAAILHLQPKVRPDHGFLESITLEHLLFSCNLTAEDMHNLSSILRMRLLVLLVGRRAERALLLSASSSRGRPRHAYHRPVVDFKQEGPVQTG